MQLVISRQSKYESDRQKREQPEREYAQPFKPLLSPLQCGVLRRWFLLRDDLRDRVQLQPASAAIRLIAPTLSSAVWTKHRSRHFNPKCYKTPEHRAQR